MKKMKQREKVKQVRDHFNALAVALEIVFKEINPEKFEADIKPKLEEIDQAISEIMETER